AWAQARLDRGPDPLPAGERAHRRARGRARDRDRARRVRTGDLPRPAQPCAALRAGAWRARCRDPDPGAGAGAQPAGRRAALAAARLRPGGGRRAGAARAGGPRGPRAARRARSRRPRGAAGAHPPAPGRARRRRRRGPARRAGGMAAQRRRLADPGRPRPWQAARARHPAAPGRPRRLRPRGGGAPSPVNWRAFPTNHRAMPHYEGDLRAPAGARFALLASRWNPRITDALVTGARKAFADHGVEADALDVVRVPGAWELPQAALHLAASGGYAALVALGCVVRGDTRHYEQVADGCAEGLMKVALETGVP